MYPSITLINILDYNKNLVEIFLSFLIMEFKIQYYDKKVINFINTCINSF